MPANPNAELRKIIQCSSLPEVLQHLHAWDIEYTMQHKTQSENDDDVPIEDFVKKLRSSV